MVTRPPGRGTPKPWAARAIRRACAPVSRSAGACAPRTALPLGALVLCATPAILPAGTDNAGSSSCSDGRRLPEAGAVLPGSTHRGQGGVRLEPDDAVAPAAAAVDDARPPGLGVDEQVEVVPDELHLVERLLQRHGPGLVVLGADDDRARAVQGPFL